MARNSRKIHHPPALIESSLPGYLRYFHPMVMDMLKSLLLAPSGGRLGIARRAMAIRAAWFHARRPEHFIDAMQIFILQIDLGSWLETVPGE